MSDKVTISARIDKTKWKLIRDYGIDASAAIRKSIDDAIKEKEMEELRVMMETTRPILKKISKTSWVKSIREDRENR